MPPPLMIESMTLLGVGVGNDRWGYLRRNQIDEESLLRKGHCLYCCRCRPRGDLLYCSLSSFSSTTRCCWPHIVQFTAWCLPNVYSTPCPPGLTTTTTTTTSHDRKKEDEEALFTFKKLGGIKVDLDGWKISTLLGSCHYWITSIEA